MSDIARRLKKAREEISRFEQSIHTKILEREKLQEEIRVSERQIQEIRRLELELRLKRSLLGRLDIEITRLNFEQKRLQREIPGVEREFQKIEMERRFGPKV